MRIVLLGLLSLACFACSASNAPTSQSSADTAQGGDAVRACTDAIDAVLTRGDSCVRCWPAYRELCATGNAAVVQGMTECLTTNACWDVGDPNTATGCMQQVVDAHPTATLASIHAKLAQMDCATRASDRIVILDSWAAMASEEAQEKIDACLGNTTSCDDANILPCFMKDGAGPIDPNLCQN